LTATTTIDNSTTTESVSVQLDNDLLKFTITKAQVNEYLDLGSSNNADLETLEFIFKNRHDKCSFGQTFDDIITIKTITK
jgi:hypothetical protein